MIDILIKLIPLTILFTILITILKSNYVKNLIILKILIFFFIIFFLPINHYLFKVLENKHEYVNLQELENVDGILVLSGGECVSKSFEYKQFYL